jgi:hypothetical protein
MPKFASSFSRAPVTPRKEFDKHIPTLEKMASQSERIRFLMKEFPDAKDREISNFLEIRPQWVWNVRHQNLKRK